MDVKTTLASMFISGMAVSIEKMSCLYYKVIL
jgi:hypothetical protein